MADQVLAQPEGYVERMIPELTPWYCYGMTCPNCVGELSQEARGASIMLWDPEQPEVLRCRHCGLQYPDPEFPETATLVCPRSGQELTFYLNEEECAHADDRSCEHAWHWVGHPTHVTFEGQIRENKVQYMIGAARSLGVAYQFDRDPRYVRCAIEILVRLAKCYRSWLYHDYWDAVADCDPLDAAWHDSSLPLEWKRHLCTSAYEGDTLERARMLQNYWGAGRLHPSVGGVGALLRLSEAYDFVHDATDAEGEPLWSPEDRALVERDLFMEWVMDAEPFLGGAGKATNVNNKSGRVYRSMAAVARVLGLTDWVEVSLAGFEGLEQKSLTYDGFSHESPAYTFSPASYFGTMLELAETLHGFEWPPGHPRGDGSVDLYRNSERFRLLMRSYLDCLRPDGGFPPLSDTNVLYRPSKRYLEIGFRRLPEHYDGALATILPNQSPSDYALFHFDAERIERRYAAEATLELPELFFPAWMTGSLRHGEGRSGAMLTLHSSPPGGHRQRDNLSIFYVAGERTVLGDHGYMGDTPMNAWFRATGSHNIVVVDEQDQAMPGRVPRLHLMATTPGVSVIEAASQVYEQCSEYRRLIALIKGPASRTFAVDIFRAKGGDRHTFRVFSEPAASDTEGAQLRFDGVDLPPEPPLPDVGASTAREDIYGLRDVRTTGDVPASWRATWLQADAAYRLWMLTSVDEVAAANGPGQETWPQAGRRVRYVDAVRSGTDLESTFVAIHEPGGPGGAKAIRSAERLETPGAAGPDAVALGIDSEWGVYHVFCSFDDEAEIDGIRFQGDFGVFCDAPDGGRWLMAAGAGTLERGGTGFAGKPAYWRSDVARSTETELIAATARPEDWPTQHEWATSYVLLHDGEHHTGFPVTTTSPNSVTVRRFPLPEMNAFELPAVRYLSVDPLN